MTKDQIVSALKDKLSVLRAEGVAHLSLFGSRARGDENQDSDLDVLIDTEPGQRFSLINLSGVALAIEDAVGIPSQIVLRRSLDPKFAERIRGDLVEVF